MEQWHRDVINKNMVQLVNKTSDIGLEMLVNYLVRDGVFTESMAAPYRDTNITGTTRKTMCFSDIQTRGPVAFEKFVTALTEAGAKDLVALLMQPRRAERHAQVYTVSAYMLENADDFVNNLQEMRVDHPETTVNFNNSTLVVNVLQAQERLDICTSGREKVPHYPMGSRPKGLALIINIIEFQGDVQPFRHGAHLDGQNMKDLFEQLGYITETHENLASSEFKAVLRKFASRREHSRLSSCMVAIFSHGSIVSDLSTVIYAADGLSIKLMDIIESFNSEKCPGLINKPKVLIFQACRGTDKNHKVAPASHRRTETDGFGNMPVRNLSDYLIAHATPRGYEAIRDRYTGSWFIQTLVQVFMENAWDTEVSEMLDMVDLQMRHLVSEDNALQTTCVEKVGFKKMFICPGLYDDTLTDTTDDSASSSSAPSTGEP